MGLKLMQKSTMADINCAVPHFLFFKGLKSNYSVRIRFNQAAVSKYEILVVFTW